MLGLPPAVLRANVPNVRGDDDVFAGAQAWRLLARGSGASASPGSRDVLIPIMDQMKSYCASAHCRARLFRDDAAYFTAETRRFAMLEEHWDVLVAPYAE